MPYSLTKLFCLCWKYRLDYSVCKFLVDNLFLHAFSVYIRLSVFNFFFQTELAIKRKITNYLNADKQFLLVTFTYGAEPSPSITPLRTLRLVVAASP